MIEWLKHAFAIGPTGPVVPPPTQAATIDRVCQEIVRRRMTLPAQIVIDSSAPLGFLTGQMMRFLEPMVGVLLNPEELREFASFIEQRGAMEYISGRLVELEKARLEKSQHKT